MADKPGQSEPASPKSTKKRLPMTLGIVLGVAIAEAAVFFIVFKFSGSGPQPAHAEQSHAIEGPAASQPAAIAEVPLLKSFRVPNDKNGHMYIYDLDLSIVVPLDQKARMEGLVKQRAAEIGDRMARIMRSASDRMLKEDDLRALRQQMLEGLREIMEDESLIERVLIPRFVPMRAD